MDEDRRIRFLIPPILFVAFLLLGALLDQKTRDFMAEHFREYDWPKLLISLLAGGGLIVFALGYVFGTLTYFVLRGSFWLRWRLQRSPGRFHEVALSKDAFPRVWGRLGASGTAERKFELSAGAAFDHSILRR